MKTFKDNKGREWKVVIDTTALGRVRDLAGFQLAGIDKASGFKVSELNDDLVKLVDVLCALCRPQAEQEKISDEEFAAGITGDVLEDAYCAMIEELASFFPGARRRAILGW